MRLEFISAGAAHGLVAALAKDAGVEAAGTFGPVGAMIAKFLAGEPCDIVILTHAQIADLAAQGRVVATTCTDLGSVPTAIAVRADDPLPDVSNEQGLRSTLLAAASVHFPDPGVATAGKHFDKVIERLGIRNEIASRLRPAASGSEAMRALAQAPASSIGCTQATEILATPGVRLVQPLPHGFDLDTVYTAAVSTKAAHPGESAAFIARLTGEAGRAARVRAGFRGFSIRRAEAGDLDAIRALVKEVLAEYGLTLDPSGTDTDLQDIESGYFASGGTFEVAVGVDGRLAGCCGVFVLDAATCELRKMYLRKDARGQGVGGRLLRRALAFARGRGSRRMELETASVLKEAIALYAGAGFQPIKRAHLASRCDQAYALDL